jgi:hypothetical protein
MDDDGWCGGGVGEERKWSAEWLIKDATVVCERLLTERDCTASWGGVVMMYSFNAGGVADR